MENVKTRRNALTVVVSIQLHPKAAQELFMKRKYRLSKSWRKFFLKKQKGEHQKSKLDLVNFSHQ